MNTPLKSIPDNGVLAVQIAPKGEFPAILRLPGGEKRRTVQTIDDAALARILDAWHTAGEPELLVDADHSSAHGGSTRAFAWASNLRIENSSLLADFKFTGAGRRAVEDREYRFVSPVFECDENDGSLLALSSIALTNTPNLPVSCVLNSESAGLINVEDNKDTRKMNRLMAALGLAPGASEDAALEAVAALNSRAAAAEKALALNEAEKFADDHKAVIENRQAVVDFYVANGKDAATALFAALKAPQAPAVTPAPQNRIVAENARTPAKSVTLNAKERLLSLPANLRAAFYADHKDELD